MPHSVQFLPGHRDDDLARRDRCRCLVHRPVAPPAEELPFLCGAEHIDALRDVRVLAISGSLRRSSSNSALVEALAQLAPQNVDVSIYRGLAELPPFNPDVEGDSTPEAVTRFRARLEACDAVLISSPEYAHGVPGVLKNALDWVVGSGQLADKPIALINASVRATHAWASLKETLTVMTARVAVAASITIPLDGRRLDAAGIAGDATLSAALRFALDVLAQGVLETSPSVGVHDPEGIVGPR